MTMTPEQVAENVKKGNAVQIDNHLTMAVVHEMHVEEFLGAIQGVLREALVSSVGSVADLYPEERGLFEVYASWDYHNKGKGRKTSEELVAEVNNTGEPERNDDESTLDD